PISLNANALSKETEALTQSVESGHKQSTTIAKTDEQSIAENGIKDNKQAFLQFIKIMQDTKNGDFYPSENLQNALEKSGKKARENALELFTKEYESKDAKLVELLKNIQETRIASKALSLIKYFTQARMMQSAIKAVPSDILMKYVNIDASQRLEVLSSLYGDFSNIMKEVALKGKKIPDPAALSEKGGAYVFNRQYRKILNIYEKIQENEELLRLLAHKNDYKTTIEIIQESKAKGLSVKQTKEAIEENKKQTAKLFDEVIRQENKPSVKPLDEFGENFEGFKGKEAINKLLEEQRGQVKGAFYKEGLGEIDLVWGEVKGSGKEAKGYGLSKIIEKHGEDFKEFGEGLEGVSKGLDEIITKGEIHTQEYGRKTIIYHKNGDVYKVGLKQNWKGEPTKNSWVITGYKEDREADKFIHSSDFTKGEALPLNSNESIAENEAKKSLFESSENFYDYHKKLLHEVNLEGLDKQNAKDKLYLNTYQTYMEKLGNLEKELSNIVQEVRPFLRLNQKDEIIDKLFRFRDKKDFRNSLKELVYLYAHKDKLGIDDIHTATMDYVESMAKYVKGLLPYDNQPSFEKLVKEKQSLFNDIIQENEGGNHNAKQNQRNEFERVERTMQNDTGGLLFKGEPDKEKPHDKRGASGGSDVHSARDELTAPQILQESDTKNSKRGSGGNGGRGYTAGEENEKSIRVDDSKRSEQISTDENHLRENNTRSYDNERYKQADNVQSSGRLYKKPIRSNGGLDNRNLPQQILNKKWSEALEKRGILSPLQNAQKEAKKAQATQKYTFTESANEKQILEDNYKALEGLLNLEKYSKKLDELDEGWDKKYTKALANFKGFGKATNALLKLKGEEKAKWDNMLKDLSIALGVKINIADLVQRSKDAYYTPDKIIEKMVKLVDDFAKNANKNLYDLYKLEPSAGIGRFFNYLPIVNSYAVEKDRLSAKMSEYLYEGLKVDNSGYENSYFKLENQFDLVIGNPPYANFKIGDKDFKENIHNYFMKKNVDNLRADGISLQIITHNFMDAKNPYTRDLIAKDAEFLGAVRLPNTTFKDASVTTDIIAFRKRNAKDKDFDAGWAKSVEIEKDVWVNQYFLDNPQNVLGKMEVVNSQFGRAIAVKNENFDLDSLNLSDFIKSDKAFKSEFDFETNSAIHKAQYELDKKREGVSFFESARGGELRYDETRGRFVVLDDNLKEHEFNVYEKIAEAKPDWKESFIETKLNALKEMMPKIVKVKEALFKLKEAELNPNASDEKIEVLRRILNKTYDELQGKNGSFRNAYGKILQKWQMYELLDDTSFELFALEKGAIVKKNSKNKSEVKGSEKSDIFYKRVTKPYVPPTHANTLMDAVNISKAEKGVIDLERLTGLLGKELEEVEKELLESKQIYKDHNGKNIEKDEFLSGNIREKIARFYDENGDLKLSDDAYIKNLQLQSLEDLKNIIPEDIELPHINIPLGANWLEREILERFFKEELDLGEVKLRYFDKTWLTNGRFEGSIEITTSKEYAADTGIKAINGADYILKMMNNESLEVKTSRKQNDGTLKFYKDPIASQKLQDLKIKLEKQLKNFIMNNDEYADMTKRTYNDIFNSEVIRKYDGSHIKLMGANENITLNPHQNNAVYRFLQKMNTLLAHDVGTGKTYTMIASAMLSKYLGLAKKSLIITPNNVCAQMAREARALYPNARIKLISGVSRAEKNRLMADVKNNDYDLVIASYESFKNMNANPRLMQDYMEKEIRYLEDLIESLRASEDSEDNRLIKTLSNRMEKEKDKLEKYLKEIANSTQNVFFEDLNIDNLIFDEAHYLKNLPIITKQVNVRGIGKANSQRALDAYIKIKHHQSLNKKLLFATGTPVTNFVSDIFVMQKYLGEEALRKKGIDNFDSWSAMFAGSSTQYELKPSGNYESTTRLRNFANLPELKQMYNEFTDTVTKEDVKKAVFEKTGKHIEPEAVYHNVVLPQSESQKVFFESIKKRARELKGKKIEKGGDNHLKILSDANKASLDMRLIYHNGEREENSKVMASARNIKANYDKWEADKGTQLVFLDSSTPKRSLSPSQKAKLEAKLNKINEKLDLYENNDIDLSDEALSKLESEKAQVEEKLNMANDSFSVYEDLKQALIEQGIKEDEIAFIHDYDGNGNSAFTKEALNHKINDGEIRVLIGSTSKMGAGSNFQKKMVALHHLDLDWTPANMEQREGRIIRQGNELFEKYGEEFKANIYYYVTEQTSDTVMLQTLNQKRKIIKQITNPNEKARFVEDTSEDDFMARLQAATSPNAEEELRFLGIDKEINLLNGEIEDNNYILKSAEKEITKQENEVLNLKKQMELLPQILAKDNKAFITKNNTMIKLEAKAEKGEQSTTEKINLAFNKTFANFIKSADKIAELGTYRGNKLFAVKLGREVVVKIGEDLQKALDFMTLSSYEIEVAFNASTRLKNAYAKLGKEEYKQGLQTSLNDAIKAKERALKKLENAKNRDLSEVHQMLNNALIERAELGIFLGKEREGDYELLAQIYKVNDDEVLNAVNLKYQKTTQIESNPHLGA
ncbi:DUF3519 domain-containing protein, partial [Campylobacter upsaliensis]|nr:DUF3519 domain-containing protein [Campylobacter upsaliensis]